MDYIFYERRVMDLETEEQINKFNITSLKGDIMGGFTTAIVALPLALAFGVASGAGAKAGLYSAIITGILSTLFGGTPAQVNGPTGAMTVVLIGLYEKFGIESLFAAMLVAGIIQILMGFLKLGRYIHLIPKPVIIGFTNGIGVLIFIKMIGYFKTSPILGIITICIMLGFPFITKKIPASLVALVLGTVLSLFFFNTTAVVGEIPKGLPHLSIPVFQISTLPEILKAGLTLALLGCIESLLASLVVDDMTKTKHNSNKELIGQGIGNTVATLFGALIGTGAIVRSAVNVNAGGRTRFSGVLHGIILLVITLKFASLASQIPLAVLGGILMGTAVKMIEYNTTRQVSYASKKAGFIIIATTLLTVLTDLTIAVLCGSLLSMFSFVIRMGNVYLRKYDLENDFGYTKEKIVSYTIEGSLFFGVAHAITSKLQIEAEEVDIIVLNLMNMPLIDSSGAIALRNIKNILEEDGKKLILAGVREEMMETLERFQLFNDNHEREISKNRIREALEKIHKKYELKEVSN
jgi:SulP family sulfate permease